MLAVGLFTVPHDVGVSGVFEAAASHGAPNHYKSFLGLVLIFVGLVLGVIGSIKVATTAPARNE